METKIVEVLLLFFLICMQCIIGRVIKRLEMLHIEFGKIFLNMPGKFRNRKVDDISGPW